jgi:TonB family protein
MGVQRCWWIVLAWGALSLPAWAEPVKLNLPAQPLESSLKQFAGQAGLTLAFDSALLNGLNAQPLQGSFETDAALKRMLSGTGLVASREGNILYIKRSSDFPSADNLKKKSSLPDLEVLREYGNNGDVRVSFVVKKNGTVINPRVIASAHPLLEAAAIDALLRSTWIPAKKDGVPVEGRSILQMSFSLKPPSGSVLLADFHGLLPFKVPAKSSKGLPAEFQYDRPPAVQLATGAVYPYALLKQGVTGKASISFIIDTDGQVIQTEILDASHEEFGWAAQAMMQSWRFEPATREGEPVQSIFMIEHVFDENARDVSLDKDAADLMREIEKAPASLLTLSDLDRQPFPRYSPWPVFPWNLKKDNKGGAVMIEFVLDEAGMVHLPRILKADYSELGWAAITAVARWRFEPPLQNGKPVKALIRMPAVFTPNEVGGLHQPDEEAMGELEPI